VKSREWHLVRRPQGWPTDDDVALVEVDVPGPTAGQVLVRNVVMSVDPYMRGRMNDRKSYSPPFALGEPMTGGAIGEVIDAGDTELPVGALVSHMAGWRDIAVLPAGGYLRLPDARPTGVPVSAYLGVLGMTGLTAYVGLLDVARTVAGETVFISGAAGAVGSTAGQIAKAVGATVLGSAGSAAKTELLTGTLGFDACLNYRDLPVAEWLAEAAPDGLDVYFDNVGGEHLEAAIGAMRTHGRLALCGAISLYNVTTPPPGPRNLSLMVGQRLTMTGFLVGDHYDRLGDFQAAMAGWLQDGTVRNLETVVPGGIGAAWGAFLGMLHGDNVGKMVVAL
jgi:NADPH-dependent curcumin reductase CurA